MSHEQLAAIIWENIGGSKNVKNLTHCATRLRFHLVDSSKANTAILEGTEGIFGIVDQGGQYQVVIGNDVPQVCAAIKKMGSFGTSGGSLPKATQNIVSRFFGMISSIFTPIIPAITAAGMVKAVLTLLTVTKVISNTSESYAIINFIADAAFFFLPFMLANSAAKKFNCNPYLAMAMAGVLMHPNFAAAVAGAESGRIALFGIPLMHASYNGTVIPIILTVYCMSFVERFAEKITPKAIKFFTKPLIIILITAPLALLILGPIGSILSGFIASAVKGLSTFAPWLVPMLVGGFIPLLVATGMHYAVFPIVFNNIATFGYDGLISPGSIVANLSQGAAALGVAAKTKQSDLKQLATSSGITAVFGGITEPALYGVNLKHKTPMIAAIIGGSIGGLFNGIMGVKRFAGGIAGLLTIPTYIGGEDMSNFLYTCIGVGIAMAVTFVVSYILFQDRVTDASTGEEIVIGRKSVKSTTVVAPMAGQIVPLSEIKDSAFSNGILGQGLAIVPVEGRVVAPVDGTVSKLFDTKHAIGITSRNGDEILIHVGINTVALRGKYFTCKVKEGQRVHKGDVLVEFDLQAVVSAGYDITSPILATNLSEDTKIILNKNTKVKELDFMMELVR